MRAVCADANTRIVGQYVMDKTGAVFQDGTYQAFAILNDDDEFVAGVVISNYREYDCEISCATETSAAWRPEVMRAVFTYIFQQLGCVRCTSITKKQNKRARDFLNSLGFQLEGNLRLGYDGQKDALLYGLLASECRYFDGGLNGEEVRAKSASRARSSGDGERSGGGEQGSCDNASELEPDRPVHAAG